MSASEEDCLVCGNPRPRHIYVDEEKPGRLPDFKVKVIYCDTCRTFSLFINGKLIKTDYLRGHVRDKDDGHSGRVAEWNLPGGIF